MIHLVINHKHLSGADSSCNNGALAIAMDNLANQTAPGVKLTKLQLVAILILIAEVTLIPLVVVVFTFARTLPRSTYFASFLDKPPNLSFLRDQYDFLLTRGVDQISAAVPLRLFELLIWILVLVILLRLVSGPLLSGLINWRKRLQAAGMSIVKFSIGLLLMAVAVWSSMDMRGSSAVPAIDSMLKRAPQVYVFFEAFVFVGASILFVEGLMALLDIVLISARERQSLRPTNAPGKL
jgi:hypothetical protein